MPNKVRNLYSHAHKKEEVLSLIEESFNYCSENSFKIDFYPLIQAGNNKNLFFIEEKNQVISHIGCLKKYIVINDLEIPVMFIGGVCTHKDHRGKGLFKELISYVHKKFENDVMAFMLWSDQIELYKKYEYFHAIESFSTPKTPIKHLSFDTKNKLKNLEQTHLEQLKNKYDQSPLRIKRNCKDWKLLSNITSSDLYLETEGSLIKNYFFKNKGQDLTNIIHEVSPNCNLSEISQYGEVWSQLPNDSSISFFLCLMKISNLTFLKTFINELVQKRIEVLQINEQKIEFKFQGSIHEEEMQLFIQGILGPNRYKELEDLPRLYISGLDSI